MMTVIAVVNKKGGVGKTTLTFNLAAALAGMGLKVGIVDMDTQGQIAVSLDLLDEYSLPPDGIYEVLANRKPIGDYLYYTDGREYRPILEVDDGSLCILPGGSKTQETSILIQERGGRYDEIGQAIYPLAKQCDVILMDTAPSNSLFTAGIYAAADYLLIPTTLDRLSMNSLYATVLEFRNLKPYHQANLMAIVPMMTHPRTMAHKVGVEELTEDYGALFWGDAQIKYSSVWREASDAADSIFSAQSNTNPAGLTMAQNAMMRLARKVKGVIDDS